MTILVPVKRVVDPYAKVKPLADGSGIDTTGVKFEINPFDEIAVEEAVRQKEANPAIQVIVVSIGGSECEEQLRKALAIGADKAILVETTNTLDSLGIAKELEAVVKQVNPDLVIMGKQATDHDSNQAGQMLAARLGWPQATFASRVVLSGGQAIVTRESDTGEESLTMPLPCLITADLRLNEPRYIALPGIIKARSKPLERQPAAVNAAPKVKLTKCESPAARPSGRKVSSVQELAQAIKERGVLA